MFVKHDRDSMLCNFNRRLTGTIMCVYGHILSIYVSLLSIMCFVNTRSCLHYDLFCRLLIHTEACVHKHIVVALLSLSVLCGVIVNYFICMKFHIVLYLNIFDCLYFWPQHNIVRLIAPNYSPLINLVLLSGMLGSRHQIFHLDVVMSIHDR